MFAHNIYKAHTQTVHQMNLEEFEDLKLEDSESEEINALNSGNKYTNRSRFHRKESKGNSTANTTPKPECSNEDDEIIVRCWNCKNTGHFAKACEQPRRVYCYACGEPNVSKTTCPKNHFKSADSKNEN